MMSITILENLKRIDPNPLEIAEAMREMMEKFGLTQEELANQIHKKRSTVANYLRLLRLPKEIQRSLREGRLTMGHAKALVGMPEAEQKKLWQTILKERISVRQTEKREKKGENPSVQLSIKNLEARLQERFGTKVTLSSKDKGGSIVFDYYNLDDLDRLLDLLGLHDQN